jgi:hypothetical protein
MLALAIGGVGPIKQPGLLGEVLRPVVLASELGGQRLLACDDRCAPLRPELGKSGIHHDDVTYRPLAVGGRARGEPDAQPSHQLLLEPRVVSLGGRHRRPVYGPAVQRQLAAVEGLHLV